MKTIDLHVRPVFHYLRMTSAPRELATPRAASMASNAGQTLIDCQTIASYILPMQSDAQ